MVALFVRSATDRIDIVATACPLRMRLNFGRAEGTREAMLFTHPATRKSDVRVIEKDEAVN
jgi:hypothetical protein